MPNVHTTLTSLFTAIANAIRGKTGSSAQIVADDFPSAIDAIPTGTPLPPLTDPASASDILDGKEAILPDANNQPVKVTGTLVPPVDTGANGLYKILVEGTTVPDIVYAPEITQINADGYRVLPLDLRGAKEIRLPNCNTMGSNKIMQVRSSLWLLELGADLNIRQTTSSSGLGFLSISDDNAGRGLKFLGINRLGQYSATTLFRVLHFWFCDLREISAFAIYNAGVGLSAQTITFDALTSLDGQGNFGAEAKSTLSSIIIRTPTLCTLSRGFTSISDISTQFTKFYVPANLLSQYASATNWTTYYNRGQIVGIDEDTTCAVNATFTPSYTGSGVTHWDKVDCQGYSVGTLDTSTGAITPTTDGRILIRGLDANDEIKYVVYLVIGTGFDTEAV